MPLYNFNVVEHMKSRVLPPKEKPADREGMAKQLRANRNSRTSSQASARSSSGPANRDG